VTAKAKKGKYFRTGGRSLEFTPRGSGRKYMLDRIPVPLWEAFRAKCKDAKVSVRARLLTLIKGDVDAN
jgi:hypothetical protein